MLDHVSIGVRDLDASAAFYEAVLATIGFRKLVSRANTVGFGKRYPEFWLNRRAGLPEPALDNGTHICLRATEIAAIHDFYEAALDAGGRGDGPPGHRREYGTTYYAAFIRDPDGNRIEVVSFVQGGQEAEMGNRNQKNSADRAKRRFARVAAAVALFTMVQIVLGAVTRLTNSGLACPDWPLCYGLWFPTPDKLALIPGVDYSFGQVMAEWLHRTNAAAVVGPLTLLMVGLAIGLSRRLPRALWWSLAALALLLAQAGLGAFTVLDGNSPWSVAVHLAAALVFLALVLTARTGVSDHWARPLSWPRSLRLGALLSALAALLTAVSGAMMSKSGATLACSGWPLCNNEFIPDLADPLIRLHLLHRLLALGTLFGVIALALAVRAGRGARGSALARAATAASVVAMIQVLFGAGVVHAFAEPALVFQVVIGAVHQALAVLLFAILAVMPQLSAVSRE